MLKIEFDDSREVVTIEGTKYSYDFFRQLGQKTRNIGSIFRIEEKTEDGNVVLRSPSKAELFKWAAETEEDGQARVERSNE